MNTLFDLSEKIQGETISYNSIHRDRSTFLAGVEKSFHSWFRLTPSFGPDLVKQILKEFNAKNGQIVLDPFAGASTTLIESQLLGYKSYGFEINPFLHFVGKTTLNWELNCSYLDIIANKIRIDFNKQKKEYENTPCESLPYKIPLIHNVYRWWRPDILKELLILKELIKTHTANYGKEYNGFFSLALAGVLIPQLTNVTLGKLQLHFKDKIHEKIDVENTYFSHLEKMICDLTLLPKDIKVDKAELLLTDSTTITENIINDKIDIVITSPPYPNRYSYVWNTRPYLYFFDIFDSAKEASTLDLKTIGGTWGTATSILNKGKIAPCSMVIEEIVLPVVEQIREKDNLMANYIMKYFNMLHLQIEKMLPLLSSNPKIVYVVGNSEIKGTFVETDIILAKIFKSFGFKETVINRFRKRNSGKNLFESNVYAS